MLDGVPMNWMTRWSSPFPPFVAEAHGGRFTCVDGHEYVDFCLGDTGAMTGHSPAPVLEAVQERLQTKGGITTMLPTEDAICVVTGLNAMSCPDDAPRAGMGTYVAVLGPQFETPAEARWLAQYGTVVGMSAAPEVRAAHAAGAECLLLALVVNQAAAVGSHDDVLATAGRFSSSLASGLITAVKARWPELV
jgi:hypothetical protein